MANSATVLNRSGSLKQLAIHYQLDLKNPMHFRIILVSNNYPSNKVCNRVAKEYEKFRVFWNRHCKNYNGTYSYNMNISDNAERVLRKKYKDLKYAKYLRDIICYIPIFLSVSNGNSYDYIPKPIVADEFLSVYFYAFTYSLNCVNKKQLVQENLNELFRLLKDYSFSNVKHMEVFQECVSQMILNNLCVLQSVFYLSQSTENELRELILSHYKDMFSDAAHISRMSYFNYMLPLCEHSLCRDSRLSYVTPILDVTPTTITSALADSTRIIDWPSISIDAANNFISQVNVTITMDVRIKHIAKFHAHIMSPGLSKFSLDFGLSELENKIYNDSLNFHLIEKEFVDTVGHFSVHSLNKKEFAQCVASFTSEYFNQRSFLRTGKEEEAFEHVLELLTKAEVHLAEVSKKMAKFGFVRSIALLYQSIVIDETLPVQCEFKCKEANRVFLTNSEFYLSDDKKSQIAAVLMDTLLVSNLVEEILVRPPNSVLKLDKTNMESLFYTTSNQNRILSIAQNIADRIVAGKKSMILQTGNPVKIADFHSDHAFYVVLKYCSSGHTVTIFIVNGGFTPAAYVVDDSYVPQDQGAGGYWKCRETEAIDLNNVDALEFLKQYIYKVMTLMYFHSNKDVEDLKYKNLIDNVYLNNAKFVGHGFKETKYFPLISSSPRTFRSQVFSNCTVYNLLCAVELLLDMDRSECLVLEHHLVCSFSYLLHQHDAKLLNYKHATSSIVP